MTNSLEIKPARRQGPLRLEAIIPIGILLALLIAYFTLLFDHNVRSALEWIGTKVNGAEVNVGSVKTSFLHGSLKISRVQMTDKQNPARNLLQVGEIDFQFLWDALLRAKFVVDNASILQIEFGAPRAKPGFVVPPVPDDGKPSSLDIAEKAVLQQTQAQYNKNMFGDIAAVLGGVNPQDQLKNIQGNLKSNAFIQNLQKDVEGKRKQWDERIKTLPKKEDLDADKTRIQALKFDIKNPAEFAASTAEAQKILKEVDQKVKIIGEVKNALNTDVKLFDTSFGEISRMVDSDIKDLESRLKIPTVDAKDFTQAIFMRMLESKVAGAQKYIELARHYLPTPKKSGAKTPETAVVPPQRSKGKTYQFPITAGYPLFWIKHAAISSVVADGPYAGDLKGEIRDVTSDPGYLKRPTVATLLGDFPNQKINGFMGEVKLDHTTEIPRESFRASVQSYALAQYPLAEGGDLQMKLNHAVASLLFQGMYEDQKISLQLQSVFKETQFEVKAANATIQQIVENILKGIPHITLNADASGSLDHLSFHLNSNLGDELSRGFKNQIQAQVDRLKGQVRSLVEAQIKTQKDQLAQQIAGMKGSALKDIDAKQNELDGARRDLQPGGAKAGGGSGGGNPLQDLKKRFGF